MHWRLDVLYSSATQIGMTATPKESEKVSNIDYFGNPVYTYSLKQGIEDGFLAPFKVINITTNIGDGWRPHKGQTDIYGNVLEDRIYNNRDYDYNIILQDRIDEVAREITEYLKSTDITNYELRALLSGIYNISEEDELWLEKYYKTAYKLLEKDSFQTAVHTMASYRWHSVPRVQLAVIWSGIESLFNVNTEVSFRISLYIANFLGENEAQAQQIFKQVRKMYSSRSSAVHGNKTKDNLESAVEESANLLTRILRRCAELNKLPDVDNLAFRVDKQKQGIKCKMLVP